MASLLIAIPLLISGLLIVTPSVLGAVNRSFFLVELTISGRAPIIFDVNWTAAGASGNLVEGSSVLFNFTFNVSDPDGFTDINHNTAIMNITLGAGQANGLANWNNTGCTTLSNYSTNYSFMSCLVRFNYYDNASSEWVINVSIEDSTGTKTVNDTYTAFTINSLTAMKLANAAINFSSVNVGTNDVAADAPLIVNNTGNFQFNTINITAKNLIGRTTASDTIGASNITVNTVAAAGGTRVNSTASMTITGATLTNGAPETGKGNMSLFFYVDVPAGLSAQTYNSTNWEIVLE